MMNVFLIEGKSDITTTAISVSHLYIYLLGLWLSLRLWFIWLNRLRLMSMCAD